MSLSRQIAASTLRMSSGLAGRKSTEGSESSNLKGAEPRKTHSRQEDHGQIKSKAGHLGKQTSVSPLSSPARKGAKAAGAPQSRRGKHAGLGDGREDESAGKKHAPVPAKSADEAELERNLLQVSISNEKTFHLQAHHFVDKGSHFKRNRSSCLFPHSTMALLHFTFTCVMHQALAATNGGSRMVSIE